MIHINLKENALVDSETGSIVRPTCWDTLIPYHSYIIGKRHPSFAQAMLQKVFDGEKVIAKMIENHQKRQQ